MRASFKGDLLDPLDHLHVVLKLDSVHGMFLFARDSIDGWSVLDKIIQDFPFLLRSNFLKNIQPSFR